MIATLLLFSGDVLGDGAEVLGDTLAERRQCLRGDGAVMLCLPGRASLRCGVDADHLYKPRLLLRCR